MQATFSNRRIGIKRYRSEDVLRSRLFIHDQLHDAVMFSLVKEDLK